MPVPANFPWGGKDLLGHQQQAGTRGGQAPGRRRGISPRRRQDRNWCQQQACPRRLLSRRRCAEARCGGRAAVRSADADAGGQRENNLAEGVTQLDGGAAQLDAGSVARAGGTDQLKGYRGANANPEAGTGTAALAQAMELLQTAANDPVQGLVPLSVVKDRIAKITAGADELADGNARIADGTGTLYSGAAAVSPSSMLRQSDAATALGLVAVLALGSVGAFLALRRKQAP